MVKTENFVRLEPSNGAQLTRAERLRERRHRERKATSPKRLKREKADRCGALHDVEHVKSAIFEGNLKK